jgi:nucleosome binding factor SPN SPT16 subunit
MCCRLKNQKVPRLVDLIMRPHLSGRKTVGMLEAHANGLRFRSKKNEVVDIMYNNIRHAIFHPCKGTINVVIHFHLKVSQDPPLPGPHTLASH